VRKTFKPFKPQYGDRKSRWLDVKVPATQLEIGRLAVAVALAIGSVLGSGAELTKEKSDAAGDLPLESSATTSSVRPLYICPPCLLQSTIPVFQ
jgi:hypothetical protein